MLCDECGEAVETDPENDDARVTCPNCGKDFGSWGEVGASLMSKLSPLANDKVKEGVAQLQRSMAKTARKSGAKFSKR
jgi:hypothetical protein